MHSNISVQCVVLHSVSVNLTLCLAAIHFGMDECVGTYFCVAMPSNIWYITPFILIHQFLFCVRIC